MKKNLLIFLFLLSAVCAFGGDTERAFSEDPYDVLTRARKYVEDKNYADAMKDYIWFFENSTKYKESLWAVKLSYCLNEWRELGNFYDPALKEFRKELLKRKERLEKGEADVWLFLEYNAFCQSDGREKDAINMFISFYNGKDKVFAKAIFPQIQYELAEMGYYSICSEYIKDPIQSLRRVEPLYNHDRDLFNKEMLFLLDVLWKNNRKTEYDQLKTEIYKLNPKDEFKGKINELERQ